MLVTFVKTEMSEIVFKEEHSYKKQSLISVNFEKADKSTESPISKEESLRKLLPMLVTLVKTEILEIVFKEEHLHKKPFSISVNFEKADKKADKSTDSKEEHLKRK
eukprot:TRINITY_DN798_c0_g1_i12.p2 TRINITY_DN798_c0_g1~~TRINITY_DN798_c0_g1_i12.p2  ORF type:complete len:106 (-),score=25.80 TRINITY_DN798_c0_g1_i12:114-431(-)